MKTATEEILSVGDRVALEYAPYMTGKIVSEAGNKAQWIVTLDNGKTWIYHSTDLVPVES